MKKIFLDYQSTTPPDPRVIKVMKPFFAEKWGNPASRHFKGEEALLEVNQARETIANFIKVPWHNLYFTNSASESNNIVLKGRWFKKIKEGWSKTLMVVSPLEHSSVWETAWALADLDKSLQVIEIPVFPDGGLDTTWLKRFVLDNKDSILFVSVQAANNEIGNIYDYNDIASFCLSYDIFFHTDATQFIGKEAPNFDNCGAVSFSSHKIYGPKGAGALYLKDNSTIVPLIDGGYQEIITSGTLNVPAILGFAEACRILNEDFYWKSEALRLGELRDCMLGILQSKITDLKLNGSSTNRLCNNLNVAIPGVDAVDLMLYLDDIAISAGSACMAGGTRVSRVLEKMGSEYAANSIRIGLGRPTSKSDLEYASDKIVQAVSVLRG